MGCAASFVSVRSFLSISTNFDCYSPPKALQRVVCAAICSIQRTSVVVVTVLPAMKRSGKVCYVTVRTTRGAYRRLRVCSEHC